MERCSNCGETYFNLHNCQKEIKQRSPVERGVMCDADKNRKVSKKIAEELMEWLKDNCWELEFDHWEGAQDDIADIVLKGINT